MCQGYSPGLGILPVLFVTCSVLTFLVTYMVAVANGHVYPYFPTISDTGGYKPEQNIFSLFLSISSFLGFVTIIVRYIHFRFVTRGLDQNRISFINILGLVFGIIATVGAGLVAAFQNNGVSLGGHIVGALAVFGGGTIYAWIQTYLTYRLLRVALNTRRLCWCRLFFSVLSTVFIVAFILFYYLSAEKWKQENHPKTHTFSDWDPEDAGYSLHVASSASEWLLMVSLFGFFATFTKEFNKVKVNLHVQRHRNFLPPFQTSMSEDDRESLDYA